MHVRVFTLRFDPVTERFDDSAVVGLHIPRKLDGRSTAKWTVGAKRREGLKLFTPGCVPPSRLAEVFAGTRRSGRADGFR